MPARPLPLPRLLLATLIAAAGCTPAGTTGVKPPAASASRKPAGLASATPSAGPGVASRPEARVTLSGAVRIIANNGAAILSNNGGAIISDNGGGLISDNGGAVVANNGAGLVSKAKYALQATPKPGRRAQPTYALRAKAAEALLADATIAFEDAAGKPVDGLDGKPLTATTDRQGRYALTAPLPAGNLVMNVALWNGGKLRAILAPGGAAAPTQDVDTASSLGAAFVLERLVKGDQALLDKVPAAEAARLQRELEASRELLADAPAYEAGALAAAAAELRAKAGGVDQVLTSIEALLLGQKNLGDGQQATAVPLNRPYGMLLEPDGTLLIAESGLGRLRAVDRAGNVSTRLDKARGVIKENVVGLRDLLRAADGTLWLGADKIDGLRKIRPDGTFEHVTNALLAELDVRSLAQLPDGTVLVGGGRRENVNGRRTQWLALAPDGTVREGASLGPEHGWIVGLATEPDGGIWFLRRSPDPVLREPFIGTLHHMAPGGAPTLVAGDMVLGTGGDLHRGPDGTIYVAESHAGRVLAFKADGTRSVVALPDAASGAPIEFPVGVYAAADGTLYVSDLAGSRIHARDAAGRWRVVAGVDGLAAGGDARTIALNAPSSVDFDPAGRMIITENGRHRLLRMVDGRLEALAGGKPGLAGDGGPQAGARFTGPTGVRFRGAEVIVLDTGNRRLRRIDAGGVITTLAGISPTGDRPRDPAPFPPDRANLESCIDVAVAADGAIYWSDVDRHQVLRLGASGQVEAVAGVLPPKGAPSLTDLIADQLPDGQKAAEAVLRMPLGLAFDARGDLYVSDSGHSVIRKVVGPATADPTIETFAGRGAAALPEVLADASVALRDGPRKDVVFGVPGGLCFDPAGNLYVVELGSRRLDMLSDIVAGGFAVDPAALPVLAPRVRKIAPDGTVTTIAGPGGRFFADPDAEDALIMPTAIAYAPDGRLVIADPGANLVRILPAGSF